MPEREWAPAERWLPTQRHFKELAALPNAQYTKPWGAQWPTRHGNESGNVTDPALRLHLGSHGNSMRRRAHDVTQWYRRKVEADHQQEHRPGAPATRAMRELQRALETWV